MSSAKRTPRYVDAIRPFEVGRRRTRRRGDPAEAGAAPAEAPANHRGVAARQGCSGAQTAVAAAARSSDARRSDALLSRGPLAGAAGQIVAGTVLVVACAGVTALRHRASLPELLRRQGRGGAPPGAAHHRGGFTGVGARRARGAGRGGRCGPGEHPGSDRRRPRQLEARPSPCDARGPTERPPDTRSCGRRGGTVGGGRWRVRRTSRHRRHRQPVLPLQTSSAAEGDAPPSGSGRRGSPRDEDHRACRRTSELRGQEVRVRARGRDPALQRGEDAIRALWERAHRRGSTRGARHGDRDRRHERSVHRTASALRSPRERTIRSTRSGSACRRWPTAPRLRPLPRSRCQSRRRRRQPVRCSCPHQSRCRCRCPLHCPARLAPLGRTSLQRGRRRAYRHSGTSRALPPGAKTWEH